MRDSEAALRGGLVQVVTPICLGPCHPSPIRDCAVVLNDALRRLGVDAQLVDVSDVDPAAPTDRQAQRFVEHLDARATDGRVQLVLLHQPDLHLGLSAAIGRAAGLMMRRSGLRRRLATYVHEFSETGTRAGLVGRLLGMALFLPLGRFGTVTVTSEHERASLRDLRVAGLPVALAFAPTLRRTQVVGIPSNVPVTPAARTAIVGRSGAELVLFGTFRRGKGTDLSGGDELGLAVLLDLIGARVRAGTLPPETCLTVIGKAIDLSAVDAPGDAPFDVLHDFVARLFALDPGAERELRTLHDHAAIETLAARAAPRYPFPIRLRLDRSLEDVSETLGRARVGILLTRHGASDRNGVLRAYALHELTILANVGVETRAAVLRGLIALYDDRERQGTPPARRPALLRREIDRALDELAVVLAGSEPEGRTVPRDAFPQLTPMDTAHALIPELAWALDRAVGPWDRAVVAGMSALLPLGRIAADLRILLGGGKATSRRIATLCALERLLRRGP